MALNGPINHADECPLSGVTRTSSRHRRMTESDPNRKSRTPICCEAQQFPFDVVGCRPPAWRAAHEATEIHYVDGRRGGVAARGARAAARPDAADRRAYGLCGERFNRAVLAQRVPGCAREVGMDGRQQSPDRTSLERR